VSPCTNAHHSLSDVYTVRKLDITKGVLSYPVKPSYAYVAVGTSGQRERGDLLKLEHLVRRVLSSGI
jgi:hypothetical protein